MMKQMFCFSFTTYLLWCTADVFKFPHSNFKKHDDSLFPSHSWVLPKDLNAEEMSAKYENGELMVTIPKRELPPKPEPRQITIS